jgi:hypothetical protein
MTHSTEKNSTEFFSVVGSPYITERHADIRSHYGERNSGDKTTGGVAVLWLIFYAVIAIAGVAGWLGGEKTFEIAAAFLK